MKTKKDSIIASDEMKEKVVTDIEGEFLEEFNSTNSGILRRIVFEHESANFLCDWTIPFGEVIGVNCFTDWYNRKCVVLYCGEKEFFRKYHVNDVKVEVMGGNFCFSN